MEKQIRKYKKIFSTFLALVIIVTTCLPFPFFCKGEGSCRTGNL